MRIFYRKATLDIREIANDDGSVTSFPSSDLGVIQADPESCIRLSVALGIPPKPIFDYCENQNIILTMTPELEKTLRDRAFCTELLNEFTASQQATEVDPISYKAVVDAFKYVLFALQMGNVLQAKNQLMEVSTTDFAPVWNETYRDYFVAKIDNYLAS